MSSIVHSPREAKGIRMLAALGLFKGMPDNASRVGATTPLSVQNGVASEE